MFRHLSMEAGSDDTSSVTLRMSWKLSDQMDAIAASIFSLLTRSLIRYY
jgi:hypothetical protein